MLAHFNYAKFLDALFETRIKQMADKAREEYSNMSEKQKRKDNIRAFAIRTIEVCQEYLLGSVQHYGMALQMGQKHVYQALPRLLAMWLEFTSLETEEVCVDDNNKDRSGQNGKCMSNVGLSYFFLSYANHLTVLCL